MFELPSVYAPQVLEVMWDESVGLCLTPQSFSNIPQACDVWNHINVQFWEYILPGCDALGYVGCTGTNFCIRATALNKVRPLGLQHSKELAQVILKMQAA